MNEEPCSLHSGNGLLRGMLHQPPGPPAGCLVFCNPLFEERKSAQRILVEMARSLCQRGYAVLRFDYRGCGDSDGDFASFSVPDWMADIGAALQFLKRKFPACPTGLLGLRLGASWGLKVASQGDVDFAVLWEPVLNGREFLEQELRRKLMKEMLTFGKSKVSREELIQNLAAGQSIDFDGYPVTPALHRNLGEVDLLSLEKPLRRCLILSIGSSDRPSQPLVRLAGSLQAAGSHVELKPVKEQPFWNLVGLVPCPALLRETAAWIAASAPGRTGA